MTRKREKTGGSRILNINATVERRWLFVFLAFALPLLLAPSATRAQSIGIVGGLNYGSLGDVEIADARTTYENRAGYHVGLYVDLPVGPIAVRPGVRYMDAGQLFSGLTQALGDETDGSIDEGLDDFDVRMFVIPVDVRLRLPFPLIKPYVFAGPELRFVSSSDGDGGLAEHLSNNEVAGNLGVGAQLSLPGVGLTLTPEARYTIGLTGLMGEDISVAGQTFQTSGAQRVNMFFLSLGLEF